MLLLVPAEDDAGAEVAVLDDGFEAEEGLGFEEEERTSEVLEEGVNTLDGAALELSTTLELERVVPDVPDVEAEDETMPLLGVPTEEPTAELDWSELEGDTVELELDPPEDELEPPDDDAEPPEEDPEPPDDEVDRPSKNNWMQPVLNPNASPTLITLKTLLLKRPMCSSIQRIPGRTRICVIQMER